jgi:hypothetical protein
VVFLPGTMTHPSFYEDSLDALSRDGLTVVGTLDPGLGMLAGPARVLPDRDVGL